MMELDTPAEGPRRQARRLGPRGRPDALGRRAPTLLVATLREPPAARETEDSARQLRAILETISVGVLLAEGPSGRLTVTNPAADRIAGEPVRRRLLRGVRRASSPWSGSTAALMDLAERPLARTFEEGRPVREILKYHRTRRPRAHPGSDHRPLPRPERRARSRRSST